MRPFDYFIGAALGFAIGQAAYAFAKGLMDKPEQLEWTVYLAEQSPEDAEMVLALQDFLSRTTIGVG